MYRPRGVVVRTLNNEVEVIRVMEPGSKRHCISIEQFEEIKKRRKEKNL
jgi:hypothetical protein